MWIFITVTEFSRDITCHEQKFFKMPRKCVIYGCKTNYDSQIIKVVNQYTKGCGDPDGLSSQAKYTR